VLLGVSSPSPSKFLVGVGVGVDAGLCVLVSFPNGCSGFVWEGRVG